MTESGTMCFFQQTGLSDKFVQGEINTYNHPKFQRIELTHTIYYWLCESLCWKFEGPTALPFAYIVVLNRRVKIQKNEQTETFLIQIKIYLKTNIT